MLTKKQQAIQHLNWVHSSEILDDLTRFARSRSAPSEVKPCEICVNLPRGNKLSRSVWGTSIVAIVSSKLNRLDGSRLAVSMGVARIFQRGGHTDSYRGYSSDCHLNIVSCLLTRRLTKGGSRAPQDPPPPPGYAYGLSVGLLTIRLDWDDSSWMVVIWKEVNSPKGITGVPNCQDSTRYEGVVIYPLDSTCPPFKQPAWGPEVRCTSTNGNLSAYYILAQLCLECKNISRYSLQRIHSVAEKKLDTKICFRILLFTS